MATINGTTGNDSLTGTAYADSITGYAGNDTINGVGGNDTIDAGDGNDSILGSDGNDLIYGGNGADTIEGGIGNDTVYGGEGNDVWLAGDTTSNSDAVYLEGGDDFAYAGWFTTGTPDTLDGGTGSDTLSLTGLPAANNQGITLNDDGTSTTTNFSSVVRNFDNVIGNDGANALTGNSSANMLDGGAGNDILTGNAGNDTLIGGAGADQASGGADNDSITGDAGNDTLSGGDGADTISGGLDNDSISGDAGNDSLSGDGGLDTISGGLGDDTISGGAGTDSLLGGDGADSIDGGSENDTIFGGEGNDTLLGGDGADSVLGENGADSLDGGLGNDTLNGGNDNDTLHGGAGADVLTGAQGMDYADYTDSGAGVNVNLSTGAASGGDAAGDTLTGVDGIYGSAHNDTMTGFDGYSTDPADSYTNIFYGNAGNDSMDGAGGDDSLYGGADNDTVLGGAGNDYVDGGTGNDSLSGGTGADTLSGGDGDDTLLGGDGNDYLDGGLGNNSYDGGLGSDTIYLQDGSSGTINGSEDGDNSDTDVLWLERGGVVSSITYDPMNSENGTITWANGSTTTFTNIENVQYVPCFTPGTMVETKDGPVAVENLVPGQRVLTRDNGYQPVRWIGRRRLSATELALRPQLQPVRIGRGALGQGLPEVDMVVSPQHRMLLTGTRAELFFGEAEVLAAALHLVGNPGIERLSLSEVSYLHVMFDAHEIIRADGAWTESFQPGDMTLRGLDDPQRDELFAIFPELRQQARPGNWASARLSLKAHEVRVLMAA